VYVAPDGQLGLIPFEVLAQQQEGGAWKYLAEERELIYLGTSRDLGRLALAATPQTGGPKTAALVGNPAFGASPQEIARVVAGVGSTPSIAARSAQRTGSPTLGSTTLGDADIPRNWQQLPQLDRLIEQAAAQLTRLGWTVTTLNNQKAVEEAVLALKGPRILQFATHGFLLDRPLQDAQDWDNPLLQSMLLLAGVNRSTADESVFYRVGKEMLTEKDARARGLNEPQLLAARLELADGQLTAYEVSGMDLRGTELVNLTACETGLGAVTAEGVAGLRQGFLMAGARSLTMSMWEVPAEETTVQIGDFYQRWLGGNKAVTRYGAFHGAQLAALATARRELGSGHPFYWAATMYVGDPGDLPPVAAESDKKAAAHLDFQFSSPIKR
jgi:CHAT domain-containing protein